MHWELELGGTDDVACECCGDRSRTVTGFLHEKQSTRAAYLVHWTRSHVLEHGAHFDFIIGRWGDQSSRSDRVSVSLVYYPGRGFTLIDAAERPAGQSELTGRALPRAAIVGSPLATEVFAMVDLVWLQDTRLAEIVDPG